MKKTLFSRGLYVEALRQTRIFGIIAAVLLFIAPILNPLFSYIDYKNDIFSGREITPDVIGCDFIFGGALFVALIFAPLITIALFQSFNRRVASDFYHSLPYTRICIFVSFSAAILTWCVSLTAIYGITAFAAYSLVPMLYIVNLAGSIDFLLTCIAATVTLVFGIIAAMSITGTPISNIAASAIILFMPRALLTAIVAAITNLAPVMSISGGFFATDFNILFNIVTRFFTYWGESYKGNIVQDIYTICLGLVYAAIAAFLFCRRKSETAGHAAQSKRIADALRITISFAISLAATILMVLEADWEFAFILYILAILAYFIWELITTRSFKALAKIFPGLAVVVVLNFAVVVSCYASSAYIHSFTPEADEIEGFYVKGDPTEYFYGYYDDEYSTFVSYAETKTSDIKLSGKEAIEIICESLKHTVEESKAGNYYNIEFNEMGDKVQYLRQKITFVSKGGIKKSRNIWITFEDYQKIIDEMNKNEEFRNVYLTLPEALDRTFEVEGSKFGYLNLTSKDVMPMYETFRDEVKALDFDEWYKYLSQYGYNSYNDEADAMYLRFRTPDSDMLYVPVSKELTPKSYLMLMKLMAEGADEYMDIICKDVKSFDFANQQFKDEDGELMYFSVNVSGYNGETGEEWDMGLHDWLYSDLEYEMGRLDPDEVIAHYIDVLDAIKKAAENGEVEADKYVAVSYYREIEVDGRYNYEDYIFYAPYPEDIELNFDYINRIVYEDEGKYPDIEVLPEGETETVVIE